jgi:xanthine dehydrogenase large subunit
MKTPEFGTDALSHVRGESRYIQDIPVPEGTLYGAVVPSPVACGRVHSISTEEAAKQEGIVAVLTAEDIPGENQIGGIIPDEQMWAYESVDFIGQPLAFVVGVTEAQAKRAAALVTAEIEACTPVLDPRKAFKENRIIGSVRTFSRGNVDAAWERCDTVVAGRFDSGGQEHLYLETQGAVAVPGENGKVYITSATQNPTHVQKTAARILGVDMHNVEVDVRRLGGAFGGKEDQASTWAAMAALGAVVCRRPVKIVLSRRDDMRFTGKRHPYSSDYKIGLTKDGKILAYQVMLYQNAGAAADLSPAVLERSLFHAAGSYYIENIKAAGASCRTNLPPNTAYRGFGGPQSMLVIESAIVRAAAVTGLRPWEIQKKNLLSDGDTFHYGMKVRGCEARRCFTRAEEQYDLSGWQQRVDEYNGKNRYSKKGLAAMPVCFGISFTNIPMNQARALVHVYVDGSVSVATGAVEMGQGVRQKLTRVAARTFSIPEEQVYVEETSTATCANTSPTAASVGTDLNGKATEQACLEIKKRLVDCAREVLGCGETSRTELREGMFYNDGKPTEVSWKAAVEAAYLKRLSLSCHAHVATPGIHFDKATETGTPFAYHVYGTAIAEATLDCIRGTYIFDAVRLVHDAGVSLNYAIDIGQTEGAVVQGLGWLTMEEVMFDSDGRLLTDMLANYKIPDIYSIPGVMDIEFLGDSKNPMGVFNSKAIGEPPFMYGLAGFFALTAAVRACRKERSPEDNWPAEADICSSPMTPEHALTLLYPDFKGGNRNG